MRTRYHNNNRLELEKEKTMTLIEAARAALDALTNCTSEYGHRCNRCDDEVDRNGKVASALRAAIEEAKMARPVAWMMVNPTTLPGHRSLHWKPQTDWHITWEAVPLYAAPQTPQPARNPWRDAMDDELVCLHLGTTETFPEPKEALRQIINWHVEVNLDPAVSSRAAELQSRGPERKPESWAQEIIDDLLGLHDSELICEEDSGDELIRLNAAICVVEEAGERWPARTPMTEGEIAGIVREAARGAATRRDGTTSTRIVRAVERHHGIGGEHE